MSGSFFGGDENIEDWDAPKSKPSRSTGKQSLPTRQSQPRPETTKPSLSKPTLPAAPSSTPERRPPSSLPSSPGLKKPPSLSTPVVKPLTPSPLKKRNVEEDYGNYEVAVEDEETADQKHIKELERLLAAQRAESVKQNNNIHEEDDDEEEEEESPKRRKSKGKKAPAKSKKKTQKDNNYSGGRKNTLLIRWTVLGSIGLFALFGLKSIVMPPDFPSPEQVIGAVKNDFGLTEFPQDKGNSFVLGFAQTYFSNTPEGEQDRYNIILNNYAPKNVAEQLRTSFFNAPMTITQGPFINNVTYTDDTSAIYNVAVEINGSQWLYSEIPVFFNKEQNAFAVSGIPGFVPGPLLSEIPGWAPENGAAPTELVTEIGGEVTRFFQAWSNPAESDLPAYLTEEASIVAQQGIQNGLIFESASTINVSESLDPNNENGPREARVEVTWVIPGQTVEAENRPSEAVNITFRSTYRLLMFPTSDGRWRVQDIKSGVRSEAGTLSTATEDPTATETN